MSSRVICVGNVIIDLAMTVPQLPERGGDVIARESKMTPGGTFNVMVAARHHGAQVAYAGAHGVGHFGDLARAAMLAEGIEVLVPASPEGDTGYDVAVTDDDAERTFFTSIGAESTLTPERLGDVHPASNDAVYISGYTLLREPNCGAVASWVNQIPATTQVLVDPGPLESSIDSFAHAVVWTRADWWSCNAREAQLATGESDPSRAADALGRRVPGGGVIVRCGADGCILRPVGGSVVQVDGFAMSVVDTNGAGDAHSGSFIAAILSGLDPVTSARRANACAALSVTRHGPATAATRDEVDALLAQAS